MPRSYKWFPWFPNQNPLYTSPFPHMCWITSHNGKYEGSANKKGDHELDPVNPAVA
jgi:hypothetical protein